MAKQVHKGEFGLSDIIMSRDEEEKSLHQVAKVITEFVRWYMI